MVVSASDTFWIRDPRLVHPLGTREEFLPQPGFVKTGNRKFPIGHENSEVEVLWLIFHLPVFVHQAAGGQRKIS